MPLLLFLSPSADVSITQLPGNVSFKMKPPLLSFGDVILEVAIGSMATRQASIGEKKQPGSFHLIVNALEFVFITAVTF